jgi:hypothetical protein
MFLMSSIFTKISGAVPCLLVRPPSTRGTLSSAGLFVVR